VLAVLHVSGFNLWNFGISPFQPNRIMSVRAPAWLAVDVGNSRVKFGLFLHEEDANSGSVLPRCLGAWAVALDQPLPWQDLHLAVEQLTNGVLAVIAGSNQRDVDRVLAAWPDTLCRRPCLVRSSEGFPLEILVEHPRRVGLDRLLSAVAASVITGRQRPAVIVDCGTATTVNLVREDGAFLGGAILPGFALCSQALHHYTEVLPLVSIEEIVSVNPETGGHPALGKNTREAIMSGIFWGQIGAIRELLARLSESVKGEPQLLLSGGGSRLLVPHLPGAAHFPYLALQGLVMVAAAGQASCAETLY
jgi:type III pantothenate kinase